MSWCTINSGGDSEHHKDKGEVKFSLCSVKHHAMKFYWVVEI
jgi:hypothetical protein